MRAKFTGLGAWSVQRASAVCMLIFVVFVLGVFIGRPLYAYAGWKASVGHPAMTVAILLFFVALLSHLWVGLRDVLLDYARPAGVRRALLGLVTAGVIGMAGWIAWIFLRLQA